MLGDKSLTPTRHELLSMVRKHSKLIGKTILEEDSSSDVEMDSRFWRDIIDLYFVRSKESRGRQDDDLVFFVKKMSLQAQRPSDNVDGNSPYFVRRWAPKLDELIAENTINIDWRRSFYLNLIAHTSYSVSVAICSHQVLRQYHTGEGKPLSPIYKEVETTPAYPDICFAVDDFDSTFDAVVSFFFWPSLLEIDISLFLSASIAMKAEKYWIVRHWHSLPLSSASTLNYCSSLLKINDYLGTVTSSFTFDSTVNGFADLQSMNPSYLLDGFN
ncbi:hypothetical protein BUALT_Bualt08G0045500 [Buddleja alternifolia]|uniref:Uncharacterized protein n=1 Tax=Buddleja alternifolia TaxID=168488 RepID=A0AAV6XAX2_9LAMI|nr:hypothetical protein BUALT_Bualt08G0045500 [Buddleja alternifolia]